MLHQAWRANNGFRKLTSRWRGFWRFHYKLGLKMCKRAVVNYSDCFSALTVYKADFKITRRHLKTSFDTRDWERIWHKENSESLSSLAINSIYQLEMSPQNHHVRSFRILERKKYPSKNVAKAWSGHSSITTVRHSQTFISFYCSYQRDS